jgi:histone H3/H4
LIKDTDEKEETFLKQIDEREEKIRMLEDTSTSRLDDKVFVKTILNMDQPKMRLEDKLAKTNVNSSGHGQNRSSGPTSSKMGTFTGKENWRPYLLQFCHIANKYEWSDQDRLDKPIECLRDRALNLFDKNNYKLACKKMEDWFGCKDLPQITRRQLQELRQLPEELLEEYAERAQDLAVDGFPATSDDFIQIVATDAFLKGCHDKRATLTAMDQDPENLVRAVQFVKSVMTNQRVIWGIKKQM